MTPNKEGVWKYFVPASWDIFRKYIIIDEYWDEVEVYFGPNGALCVWCEDVGVSQFEQNVTIGDEMNGHFLAHVFFDETNKCEFVRELN